MMNIDGFLREHASAVHPAKKPIIMIPDVDAALNFKQDPETEKLYEQHETRMKVPLAMNLPALLVQLPYIVFRADRSDFVPRGMEVQAWRAMYLPFAGLLFWRVAGRGVEAFLSSIRKHIDPKISWIEAVLAAVMCLFGAVMVIGIVFSPPNDRKDMLIAAAGFALWAALSFPLFLARIFQVRLQKHAAPNATA